MTEAPSSTPATQRVQEEQHTAAQTCSATLQAVDTQLQGPPKRCATCFKRKPARKFPQPAPQAGAPPTVCNRCLRRQPGQHIASCRVQQVNSETSHSQDQHVVTAVKAECPTFKPSTARGPHQRQPAVQPAQQTVKRKRTPPLNAVVPAAKGSLHLNSAAPRPSCLRCSSPSVHTAAALSASQQQGSARAGNTAAQQEGLVQQHEQRQPQPPKQQEQQEAEAEDGAGQNKTCSACSTLLPLSQFQKAKGQPAGVAATCKSCVKVRRAKQLGQPLEHKCAKCGSVKPIVEFARDQRPPKCHHGHCRDCIRGYPRDKKLKVTPAEKQCYTCKEKKPAADFWRNLNSSDGLRNHCKACQMKTTANQPRVLEPCIKCCSCHQMKPNGDFSHNKASSTGLSFYCRLCDNARKHPECKAASLDQAELTRRALQRQAEPAPAEFDCFKDNH